MTPRPQPQPPVSPGDVIAEKFRVERVLGVGGMGVVVAAVHIELQERVAIKFLLPEIAENAEVVARFVQEARASARIRSEHVVRVSDVGRLANGAPYLVMEYLEGSDLGHVLRTGGRLSLADAVEYVLQACEALAEAHVRGIVHRDLKPANLFLARRADGSPVIKVLDFGISKVIQEGSGADFGLTTQSTVIGSPLYMSPEQLASAKDVDARADVWSLGIAMYELLTGKLPFVGQTILQLCTAIVSQPAPRVTLARPDLPRALDAVLEHCLEKDRGRRYASVAELAVALQPFAPIQAITSIGRVSKTLGFSPGAAITAAAEAAPAGPPQLEPPGAPAPPPALMTVTAPLAPGAVADPRAPQPSHSGAGPVEPRTGLTWQEPGTGPAPRSRLAVLVALPLATLVLGGLGMFLLLGRSAPGDAAPAPTSDATPRAAASSSASVTAEEIARPPAQLAESATLDPAAAPRTADPAASSPAGKRAKPPAARPARPTPRPPMGLPDDRK